ncbi:MAG: 4Fe-4S dicluster domain-containing protein [Candidatus Thorarchaeota archaeon]
MPIDKTYRDTWRRIGLHEGHPVWQFEDNESSRIHGSIVGVDFSLCYGCEKCITACPTNVFVALIDERNRPVVDPLNESECILCLVCEIVCPVEAISIEREGGSEDTLKSLLQSSE